VIFENFTEEVEEADKDGSIHYLYGERFERIIDKPDRKKNAWEMMLEGKKNNPIFSAVSHRIHKECQGDYDVEQRKRVRELGFKWKGALWPA
jgi:hypothetical protein